MIRFKHLSGRHRFRRGHQRSREQRGTLRRLVGVAALAVGLLAVAPAATQAAPFPPSLNFAYDIAVGFWGEEPAACGSIDRQVVPAGSLGNPEIGAISGMSTYVPADAAPGSLNCFLWIDRAYAEPIIFDLVCAVMVHHVGLLLGMEDSPDPSNVMYERIPVPQVCRVKGRQSARLYLLHLKFRWLQARRGPKIRRVRHRVRRELRSEAQRFWAMPRQMLDRDATG